MDRAVRKSVWQVFTRQGGVVAGFLCASAVIAGLGAGAWAWQAHRIDTRWTPTTGVLLRKDAVSGTGPGGEVYRLTYRLTAPEDEGFISTLEVYRAAFDAAHVGDAVPLRVAPGAHGKAVEDSRATWALVPDFLFEAGILALFGTALGIRALRIARRMASLRDTGERRSARVTAVERVCWLRRSSNWRMTWQDEAGQSGRTKLDGQDWWRGPGPGFPPVGATITIYADPTGRLPAVWEGDCGAR